MAHEVHQVLFHPFVEELVVSVLYLGRSPFIERLCHKHHAHLVTGFYKLRGRHVVGCAYRIASHILEYPDLASDACLVGDSSQRAEVMVVAHALELDSFPVEEKSLPVYDLRGTDTECGGVLILECAAFVNL